ncbi:hypothetical protein GMOD_00000907 [Pyrenophora seminiperda CCB06]|uniref:Uncharacterized protein n=1 Tax=Pyrenophora seminiperda CCB06 TaxID=1302712 RepID=A0A3M7LXY5_9PLEO|nr:hypothetical protein GMOD_00000907 [Pyrenophora seminiperda CCB06]
MYFRPILSCALLLSITLPTFATPVSSESANALESRNRPGCSKRIGGCQGACSLNLLNCVVVVNGSGVFPCARGKCQAPGDLCVAFGDAGTICGKN